MRIIKWKYVIDYCKNDRKMRNAFDRFYEITKDSNWRKPQDVINSFSNTDLVTCKKAKTSRIVFNVGTNKYRMIVGYYFAPNQMYLYIKFVGTHEDYIKIDVCKIDMFKRK